MKAQISMEYMMIIVLGLMITLTGVYALRSFIFGTNTDLTRQRLAQFSSELIDEAKEIHFYGPPSNTVLKTNMPSGIDDMFILNQSEEYFIGYVLGDEVILYDVPMPVFFLDTVACSNDYCSDKDCKCLRRRYFSSGYKTFSLRSTYNCSDKPDQGTYEPPTDDEPIDMYLVIDKSGSMYNNDIGDLRRIDLVKNGALRLVSSPGWIEDDELGLISFCEDVDVDVYRDDMDYDQKSALRSGVQDIDKCWFTNTWDAIHEAAANLIGEERSFILLLSDGDPMVPGESDPEGRTLAAADYAAANDVIIYTVSLEGAGYAILEEIADRTGGQVFEVYSEEDVSDIIEYIERDVFNPGRISYPNIIRQASCIRVEAR